MKKKIILMLSIISALLILLALSVSATENYDYEYALGDKTTLSHYTKFNYTGTNGQVEIYNEWKDEITITYVDKDGNALTKVPMWEYDEEDGKYYGLVWYIADQELSYTLADQYKWAQGPDGWGNQYDTEGDQRPKYTSAVYTLAKIRAVDLTYETVNETKSFSYDNTEKQGESCIWEWSRNDDQTSYKLLKSIYLDAEKTIRLQAPVYGSYTSLVDNGYGTYEKQWEVVGDRIITANFKELDFQGHYYHWSNPSCWAFVSNLQCLWYPDTVLFVQSSFGNGIREIEFEGIEVIKCQLFRDCKYLTEFRVPPKCEYLETEMFRGSGLKTIRYGESVKVVDHSIFSGITPTTYYLTTNFLSDSYINGFTNTSWGYGYIINSTEATVYFSGTQAEAEALWVKISADNTSYTEVYYYDYNSVTERETTTGMAIFYNYNLCDALYRSQHKDGEIALEYQDAVYLSKADLCTKCDRCGNKTIKETYDQLFKSIGYSYSSNAVLQGFAINKSVIDKYKAYYNADIEFGLVAAISDNVTNGEILNATSKASVDFTKKDYDIFEMKISNISDANKEKSFFLCAYVTIGDKTYYLNKDTSSTDATSFAVTYKSIAEATDSDLIVQR